MVQSLPSQHDGHRVHADRRRRAWSASPSTAGCSPRPTRAVSAPPRGCAGRCAPTRRRGVGPRPRRPGARLLRVPHHRRHRGRGPRPVGSERRAGGAGRRRRVLRPACDRCERHTSHDRTGRVRSTGFTGRRGDGTTRAASITAARMRGRGAGPARSAGAATESAAITAPSPSRTGAPTDTTPTRLSSRFSAQPRAAISRSRARSAGSSTIVYGVIRRGTHARSRTSSSSGGNAASSTFPVLVVGAGSRVPTLGEDPDGVRALQAVDVDRLQPVEHRELHGLAGRRPQRRHHRQRRFVQVTAGRDARAQVEDGQPQPVARRRALHQLLGGEGGEHPVDRRGREAQPPGQLGDAELAVGVRELLEQPRGVAHGRQLPRGPSLHTGRLPCRGPSRYLPSSPMLTAEQNDELTQVEPGTRMGEVLRRYWYPVAFTRELAEFPVKRVELLGEFFALWRQPSGRYGIVPEPCPHRKASMAYGVVEVRRAALPVPRLEVRPRGRVHRPARRARQHQLRRPGAGHRREGRGAGRADLGLRRAATRRRCCRASTPT